MITIKDVAEKAGVSISTVSNVCTGNKAVSRELTEKVNEAMQELDYHPNPIASGLRGKRTKTVGVLIPWYSQPFFMEILQGIQDQASQMGYAIISYETKSVFENELDALSLMYRSMVDGVIIVSQAINYPEKKVAKFCKLLEKFNKGDKTSKARPVVSIEKTYPVEGIQTLLLNNEQAAYEATMHLIDKGHRKVAHITGRKESDIAQLRVKGYKRALSEAGIGIHPEWIRHAEYSVTHGYNAMVDLLNNTDISAVFAGNDAIGVGAIRAAHEFGLSVPEDVAVIGFDNVFFDELIIPTLTTVAVPSYSMGEKAMELIQKGLRGEMTKSGTSIMPTEVVVRASTDIQIAKQARHAKFSRVVGDRR